MTKIPREFTLDAAEDTLETAIAIIAKQEYQHYCLYEYRATWYIGLGSHASLQIDSTGQKATIFDNDTTESFSVHESLPSIARRFIRNHALHGKVFGQVGFEYGAHVGCQSYNPGQWPLLSLMVPKVQISLHKDHTRVLGYIEDETRAICKLVQSLSNLSASNYLATTCCPGIDIRANPEVYMSRVAKAISDIRNGLYNKAVLSREVPVPFRVDMLATLRLGRRSNTPARTFAFSHMGHQATGFSPEVLLATRHGNASTEVVAGTRLVDRADPGESRQKLLDDPKEVMEHVTVIKGFKKQLETTCVPGSVCISDLMSVVDRGNVHHISSLVSGRLLPDQDGWDVLAHMLGSVTSPAPPIHLRDGILQCIEPCPRDLYFGAFVMFDLESDLFDAALVLRTIFQDERRQWLRAGAAVTKYSTPEREFEETCEKLKGIASHVTMDVTL